MAFGMEITKANGVRYATPDTHFMHLHSIFNHTTGGGNGYKKEYINTGVTVNHAIFPFVKHLVQPSNGWDPIGLGPMTNINGYWHLEFLSYTGGIPYRIYIFSSENPPARGYGIAFFNQQGQVTYSADTIPLEIHHYTAGMPFNGPHGTLGFVDVGHPVAVYPGVWGTHSGDGGHVWSAVFPIANGNLISTAGGYNNVYAQFGYANSGAFDKDFSGSVVYINTSHYE